MTNPDYFPMFSSIKPENIVRTVKETLDFCQHSVEQLINNEKIFTWDNLCKPLSIIHDRLHKVWGPIEHLYSVKSSVKLLKAYEECLPYFAKYHTWMGQNIELYNAYCSLRNSKHYEELSIEQKKSISNSIRDFKLSGINLSRIQQKKYGKIIYRLSELSFIFNNNVLDATMGWRKLITDDQQLTGIPQISLDIAHNKAKSENYQGWLLTLDNPCYLSVMTYADNEKLRKELYQAYNTRASDQGPNAGKWDNTPIIDEILALRYELSTMLGFNNYAEESLFTKMAKDPQKVFSFLSTLINVLKPKVTNEFKQLCLFAKKNFKVTTMDPWDIAYYSEKQKQHLFNIDDEKLRSYFPIHQVLNGLFEIIHRIYGIFIKERTNIDVWHPDVRFFDFFDSKGKLRGSCYLDLFTRDNKRSGAWMSECISRMRTPNGELQTPVALVVCNFNNPVDNNPSLLTHSEVTTLFHEWGHCLHHILSDIDIPEVSGINGVPWDAIELPSQLMENYCWEPEAIKLISGHYKTSNSLPDKELSQLIKMRNYQAAIIILRQLELSMFDLRIHHDYDKDLHFMDLFYEIIKQISVLPYVEWGRFPHVFKHIFSGGYAAGYYSYLWANVLSADIWSRFKEEGIFNRLTGESFRNNILSRGGAEDTMILFTRFRGREPKLDAFLKQYSIT